MSYEAKDPIALLPRAAAQLLDSLRKATGVITPALNSFSVTSDNWQHAVDVDVPLPGTVYDVVPSATPTQGQDRKFRRSTLSIDNWVATDVNWTDDVASQIETGKVGKTINQMAIDLATKVNERAYAKLASLATYSAGAVNATPFATNDAALRDVRKIFAKNDVPGASRLLVVDPDAYSNALGLDRFVNASVVGDGRSPIVTGAVGTKYGFDMTESNYIPTFATAAATTGAMTVGANAAVGATTISIAKAAGVDQPLAFGDMITIGGRNYRIKTAVVVQEADSTQVELTTGLREAIVSGQAITLTGAHKVNLALWTPGVAFASRVVSQASLAAAGANVVQITDPLTNLTIRLELKRQEFQTKLVADIAFGLTSVYDEAVVALLAQP